MSEEESKLPNIRVYQPWSAPLLHFRLSEEQIEDLLEITDLILEDENKKSYNDKLAGEIESEWEVPDLEDLSEVLNLTTIATQYFQVLASQNYLEVDEWMETRYFLLWLAEEPNKPEWLKRELTYQLLKAE